MKSIVLALAAALFPLAAHAGENVAYTVDGEAFEGYRAKPAGASKGLVVIIHAWGGVTEYEQKRADMIAALGYDAFALDLYGKGNRPTDTDARRERRRSSTKTARGCGTSCSRAPHSARRRRHLCHHGRCRGAGART